MTRLRGSVAGALSGVTARNLVRAALDEQIRELQRGGAPAALGASLRKAAELAVERASTEEVRTLAERIAAAQGPEIELMSGWLQTWDEELPAGAEQCAVCRAAGEAADPPADGERSAPDRSSRQLRLPQYLPSATGAAQ
mgnify:CR=1 FL=1